MHELSTADSTIVTGSDRLARRLQERVADAHIAAGRSAWERPDILPEGAFWRRLAAELQQDAALPIAHRRVLPRHGMQCRWESHIAETFGDTPLLQTSGAAKSALDAWQLCRDWLLDVDALASDPLEETRMLIQWGRRFEQECDQQMLLPEYALPDAVLATLEQFPAARGCLPKKIQLLGFMEFTTRDMQRWDALRGLGVEVETLDTAEKENDVHVVACSDARTEIAAAAAWAREQLHANPHARIGIVVPDLAARRAALKRALTEALVPARVARFDRAPLPFNFSLGEPLAEYALAADALTVLVLANNRVEFSDAARLCRSPYVGIAEEITPRRQLESALRHDGYAEFSLSDFRYVAAREQCPAFAAALEKFRDTVRRCSDEVLPSTWARRFSAWLELFGWCRARKLDSDEYQARVAFNDLLGRLADFDIVLGKCSRATAFSWFSRLVNETPFQPRAADAPVQVLGLLEATGMKFDALWVMGLTDDVLPAAPRPNPFLPIDVQRAKNLPQSSAARELKFAQEIFSGLRRAAPLIYCSYPEREKDSELGPSPFLRGHTIVASPDLPPTPAQQWFASTSLESISDVRGPVHAGGAVRGGTGLLQNQSLCPFRAFAVHRLHADDWPTPQPGPDALIRGLITHRVLEKLWTQWRTQRELRNVHAAGELQSVVQAIVREVVVDSAKKMHHRWTESLQEIEIRRLGNVLMRWFEQVELPRPDFEVVEIEGRLVDGTDAHTRVHAGPLDLGGKLDRVDRLADGGELIIDYKSGEAPGTNDFFGERPRAPQLPAYVVARKQAGKAVATGIAVASLKTGNEKLQGVMRVDGDDKQSPGIASMVNVAKTREVGDWTEAVEHWERIVNKLGTAFANGEASVDPLRGACDYCHLSTLCRIHEREREAVEENGE